MSITNYQLVSTQTAQRTLDVTYRADLVNTGTALGAVTAIVTSLNPSVIQVVAGQDTLQFGPSPANSQVTSSNTFTLQVDSNISVDFTQLQWTFETAGILLPANLTVTPGGTANFPVTLGTAAPAGGVIVTLTSSNPAVATVWPSSLFISPGVTAPRGTTTVTGNIAGSAIITASAPGYANANGQVLVSSGGSTAITMSFWPGSMTLNTTATQNLTLNLSVPAPSGLVINLSSTDMTVATVPSTVSFGAGATSATVPVTGLAAGSVTITASAPNIASATASVTVTQPTGGGILLPSGVTVSPGNTVNFPVALGTATPGGVSITLSSSNPAIANVFPLNISIPAGASTSRQVPALSGIAGGSVTITASAPGYPTASVQVQVTGGSTTTTTTMSFSPGSLTMNGSGTQSLTLSLSTPAASGLVVNLTSSNVSVATVPSTVSFGANTATVTVPVTGLAAGSATITAGAANVASATAGVTVTQAAAGGILLPSGMTLTDGNTANFPVSLGTASAAGVTITLASTNPAIATVFPSTISIPAGATTSRQVPTVSGITGGSASITASAFGYPTASAPVQVSGGSAPAPTTISFSPASLTITGTAAQNLALNLSVPAPSALVVTLSSSDVTVATVPASVTFGTGATSVSVPVTGVASGSVTITASATNLANATASVTVSIAQSGSGAIQLPASATVGLNQSVALQVTLASAAPSGGVTVSLASSDTSTATVTPSVFISARNTTPTTQPLVSGVQIGSASVTASAPGFTPATAQVQVLPASQGSSYFSPVFGLAIIAGSSQNLTLNLTPVPANSVTVVLSSSDNTLATVPATVTYLANSGGVTVPVTGVGVGSVTITAVTPNFGTATATVSVTSLYGASIIWYGACWSTLTFNGVSGNYQGVDFSLSTPVPVAIQGSLFFSSNCDPSQGIDNLNDNGTLFGSTHSILGFIHYPNVIPSSAMYWIGNATSFGTCPPGSICSGCLTYTQATPNCSILP